MEVDGLRTEWLKAKKEATEQKAVVEQAAAELALVKTEREKHEARGLKCNRSSKMPS